MCQRTWETTLCLRPICYWGGLADLDELGVLGLLGVVNTLGTLDEPCELYELGVLDRLGAPAENSNKRSDW